MGLFLAELCENNSNYFNLFLFEKNLFADIRLLLIHELISKKFNNQLRSIDHIQQFFDRIQVLIFINRLTILLFCFSGKFQFNQCKFIRRVDKVYLLSL
jgi:hypothetical protein